MTKAPNRSGKPKMNPGDQAPPEPPARVRTSVLNAKERVGSADRAAIKRYWQDQGGPGRRLIRSQDVRSEAIAPLPSVTLYHAVAARKGRFS